MTSPQEAPLSQVSSTRDGVPRGGPGSDSGSSLQGRKGKDLGELSQLLSLLKFEEHRMGGEPPGAPGAEARSPLSAAGSRPSSENMVRNAFTTVLYCAERGAGIQCYCSATSQLQ